METIEPSIKPFPWGLISLIIFILGIISWVIFFIGLSQSSWMFTFFINPIGFILGIVGLVKKKPFSAAAVAGNALMSISFFVYMFTGYLTEYINHEILKINW